MKNYDCKWLRCRAWCHKKGHSVSRPTVQKVADFLCYLRDELKYRVPTVKAYRSMLSAICRQRGIDLTNDPDIRDIISSCQIEVPKRTVLAPSWDLAKVLEALRSPPYEPLAEASFRELSKKTIFLLSLATAKRVGELQEVHRWVAFRGGDAILGYRSQFLAKTATSSRFPGTL